MEMTETRSGEFLVRHNDGGTSRSWLCTMLGDGVVEVTDIARRVTREYAVNRLPYWPWNFLRHHTQPSPIPGYKPLKKRDLGKMTDDERDVRLAVTLCEVDGLEEERLAAMETVT